MRGINHWLGIFDEVPAFRPEQCAHGDLSYRFKGEILCNDCQTVIDWWRG